MKKKTMKSMEWKQKKDVSLKFILFSKPNKKHLEYDHSLCLIIYHTRQCSGVRFLKKGGRGGVSW